MNETMNENEISSGSIPMVRALPKATRPLLESADTNSFAASRKIRRTVDIIPRVAPKDKVATVIVVVTVDITLPPFRTIQCIVTLYKI